MMKKSRKLAALTAALGVSMAALAIGAQAHAETYLRGEISGGFSDQYSLPGPNADLDNAWRVDGAVGANIAPHVRLEGDLAYSKADIQGGGDSKATIGLGNVYYDFGDNSKFTPFVGAGVGWGKFDTSVGDDDSWAYQLTAGVSRAFSDRLTGEVAYHYTAAPDLTISGTDADYKSSFVGAGLRWKLGG
jgi:opacity protein-like surface antigen